MNAAGPGPRLEAIVTDVGLRNAVAGVRALGRAGVSIMGIAPDPSAAGMRSRYLRERALAPDAATDPSGFADRVAQMASERVAESGHPVMIYPGSEEAIDAALTYLPRDAALLPWSYESTRTLRDKAALSQLCEQAGLAAPRTLALGTPHQLLATKMSAPAVLKPVGAGGGRVVVTREQPSLERALREWRDQAETVLVQELAEGSLVSLGLVLGDNNTIVAAFQHRALETWPRSGGTVAVAVSEPVGTDLLEVATTLLAAARHRGFAQVQVLRGSGGISVIDVNCGFPGSLPLAYACGVNLPLAAHLAATGSQMPPADTYPAGKRYRWLQADLMAARSGAPGALLRRPGSAGAVWAADDPWPSLVLSRRLISAAFSRRGGGAE